MNKISVKTNSGCLLKINNKLSGGGGNGAIYDGVYKNKNVFLKYLVNKDNEVNEWVSKNPDWNDSIS